MALLDAAIKNELNIVVAHVNYRKRDVSVFEQKSLEKYCEERGIKIYVLDLLKSKPTRNFQDWARKTRYEFFKRVSDEENADFTLIAHQEDDVFETYLMQKNRGNYVKFPGIPEKNEVFGVKVIRPLLSYTKQQLIQYDDQNHVPYSIDQSNLTDMYTRNKIRHSIVEKLTKEERDDLRKEIESSSHQFNNFGTKIKVEDFLNYTYEDIVSLLDHFMEISKVHRSLSKSFIREIKKAFKTNSAHRFEISQNLWLEKDYEEVYIVNALKIRPYTKQFNQKTELPFISIDFSSGAMDRGIENINQKLTVKNIEKNDMFKIKNYSKRVSRLFIDWKMPLFLREIWPGIYDENMSLIYVPRYRKNFKEIHASKFVIDIDYFLKF
jgi:tRNA(Ile)-lysidine synthase